MRVVELALIALREHVIRIFGCHVLSQDHILTTPDSRRRQTLAKQNEILNEEKSGLQIDGIGKELIDPKKPFVEPAISVPVDVLEATTFFQTATSGATN